MNKDIKEIIKKNKYRSKFYKTVKKKNHHTSSPIKEKINTKVNNVSDEDKPKQPLFKMNTFINRMLIACVVLLVGLIINKDDRFEQYALYQSSHMNIKQIDHFVTTNFGRIFPVPKNDDLYVSLPTIDMYNSTSYSDGVLVTTSLYEGIQSQAEGIVVEIREDDDLGQIIVIQTKEGHLYEYAMLEDVKVNLYNRIDYGELIGIAKINSDLSAQYYLAIKDDEGDYLDVIEVVNS